MAKGNSPGQTGEGKQVEVEFLRTVQYECDGRRKGPTFHKGRRYKFDEAFANRWIKRGAAYDTAGPPPEPPAPFQLPPMGKGGASTGAEEYQPPLAPL